MKNKNISIETLAQIVKQIVYGEPVDLRKCSPGDILISKHGTIFKYIKMDSDCFYPHVVEYPNGGLGTRNNDGSTYRFNKLPNDEDIIAVIHQ